ncbi:MAG: M24 family metallopeptidase [Candidatus Hydrothermia bacterium]
MERIKGLKKVLEERKLDGILIVKPLNIFYFSGVLVNGLLVITRDQEVLFVKRPKERPIQSGINIKYIDSLKEVQQFLNANLGNCGMELDSVPYAFVKRLSDTLQISNLVDITHDIRLIRMVKDDTEIEKIKKAGEIASKVFDNVRKVFREGMTERDLVIELEYVSKHFGNLGIYRMHSFGNEASFSHILQGDSALISSYLDAPTGGPGVSQAFPQGASFNKISKGKPFTIDVMINYDGYIVDATRTFVWGNPGKEILETWQKLMDIYNFIQEKLLVGGIPEDIYMATLQKAESLKVSELFMGPGCDKVKFVGHGVGLEVDEYPFIAKGFKVPIDKNTVVAIEPKFISRDFGIMGIEDTFIVKPEGPVSVIPFPGELQII